MEGSRPFDAEVDFDHQRRSRTPRPPDLPRRRRSRRPRRPRPGRSETVARIAWAVPWIAIALTVVIVGGVVFAAAMIGFACIGLVEFFRMTRDAHPFVPVAFAAAAAMVVAAYYGTHFQIVIAFVCVFPVMFVAAVARPSRDGVMIAMAVTVFGIVWIGVPFVHAVLLRELPDHGAGLLVDVLVATFVADTAAYAGGRMFGRHRLAPALSPNKTLEGLAFGFVGGAMGFWFAGLYQDWMSGIDALAIGACVAALAPVGDLFESMIKRDLAVKDSGTVFGPHGGILDRLDALLFTIVAGYYLSVALIY
jgi:phosphatidate cytidylyltransferase